jgi:hypothetical protein
MQQTKFMLETKCLRALLLVVLTSPFARIGFAKEGVHNTSSRRAKQLVLKLKCRVMFFELVQCRYPADRVTPRTSSKSRRRARRALTRAHISMTSGYTTRHGQLGCCHTSRGASSRLLARGSSGAAMCPVPQLLSLDSGQLGCCHAVRGTSSHLLTQDSSGATTCPVAPAPASWLRVAPEPPHVPWSSTDCGLLK